jgi:hypothetical protein
MTQQPKALQLADAMENAEYPNDYDVAAELRRQHAEIERLTKFCDDLICELSGLRMAANMQKRIDELKASPSAQGQWVGLTDEQINQYDYQYRDLLYDAEKMLRENNMPLKPHPADPDKVVYVPRQYDLPTKREWVGLTDTQIEQVYFEVVKKHRGAPMPWGQVQFGKALEAKLKEKNT